MIAKHGFYIVALAVVGMVAGCSNEEKPSSASSATSVNVVGTQPVGNPEAVKQAVKVDGPGPASEIGTGTLKFDVSNDPQYTGKTTVVTKDGKQPEAGQTISPARGTFTWEPGK